MSNSFHFTPSRLRSKEENLDTFFHFFSRIPEDLSRPALKIWSDMESAIRFKHNKTLPVPNISMVDNYENPTSSYFQYGWNSYNSYILFMAPNWVNIRGAVGGSIIEGTMNDKIIQNLSEAAAEV